jgi:RNA recognition motif-containing protein
MKRTENTKDEFKSRKSYKIYPEKIIRNEDKRTSIMIKGIPTSMAKSEVRNLVDKYGNINYLYVITSSIYNYSIAFINVINYKSIIPLFMNLRNCRIENSGKIYNLKIMYSIVQGKQELKKYMKSRKIFNY